MSHQLLAHSPDLVRLKDDGYAVEVRGQFLLVHEVPYLTSKKQVSYGTLVSNLNLAGNITTKPDTHVAHFIGEHPCDKNGSHISAIVHTSRKQKLREDIEINHSFSNKPAGGYSDYYHKMVSYINIITAPATTVNPNVTPRCYRIIENIDEDSVLVYQDTNASKAQIHPLSEKFKGQKVAIIGLGGTGSYLLDLIAKSPINEIHLFDGDKYLQKNSFRSPGAASIEELQERLDKVAYLKRKYSKMHKGIHAHPVNITEQNFNELNQMTMVFICIDKAKIKKSLFQHLNSLKIPFIDVGMGVQLIDGKLNGNMRVTSVMGSKIDHIERCISLEELPDDEYNQNIQIAELNSMNASLAVMKWKKFLGFYHDFEYENQTIFEFNTNAMIKGEYES